MQSDIIGIPSQRRLSTPPHLSRLLAPTAEGGASGAPSEDSDRILIVEDDLLIASQMEAALTDAGFQIAGTASTGEEALQLAHAQSPTLVVMDIRLASDRDGIDAERGHARMRRASLDVDVPAPGSGGCR